MVAGIPDGFKEHRFTTGDITINYVEGPDGGLPLLLIPGQMESWQGYKAVLPTLASRFHVFVPDLRGHGKSTHTPGQYSYNQCGEDLKAFIQEVIQQPTLVAGLSSGGVLAIWLAAYVPNMILAVVSEDPPIFSSTWPRIQDEPYMRYMFQLAVDTLGGPGPRDLKAYYRRIGLPVEGEPELRTIPSIIVEAIFLLFRINRTLRPGCPYDVPFLPFHMRAPLKFLSDYDPDFSRATIEGDLSDDFSPEDALQRVKCPMLLLRASASRHEKWGLLGAIDDDDLAQVVELVDDIKVVEVDGRHEIHMEQPQLYITKLARFIDDLQTRNQLSV